MQRFVKDLTLENHTGCHQPASMSGGSLVFFSQRQATCYACWLSTRIHPMVAEAANHDTPCDTAVTLKDSLACCPDPPRPTRTGPLEIGTFLVSLTGSSWDEEAFFNVSQEMPAFLRVKV